MGSFTKIKFSFLQSYMTPLPVKTERVEYISYIKRFKNDLTFTYTQRSHSYAHSQPML